MTEEEIKALQVAKEEAERRASEAEAAAIAARTEADKAKVDLGNTVEELKSERQKKAEALAKLNINNTEPDVSSLIEQALTQKETERRTAELADAINEFKNSKSEFQTDTTGIVFGKFQEHLKRFNLSDVKSKEQAKSRLEEVYKFVNFKSNNGSSQEYEGTPSGSNTPPTNNNGTSLDTAKILESTGMDKAKFEKLKSKYPDALIGIGIE